VRSAFMIVVDPARISHSINHDHEEPDRAA
jgi:hypothetical protein